jgi:Domain of unknown function (DUF5597)/Beta-galactosidase
MAYMKFLISLLLFAAVTGAAQTAPLPQIRQNGAVKQFFLDDKPYIMLAGELHNSSASSIEYMRPIWDKLAALHLNTVIGTASWELVEPKEGKFDFSLVDDQINQARQRNMRLVLIWFATWKNAGSSYPPDWVRADPKRFPPMVLNVRPDGGMSTFLAKKSEEEGTGPLSPFGKETMKADAKAFAALMGHIKEVDPQHTVIMMQVENEIGSLGDSRDRSPMADAAWAGPVPADLMKYLSDHKDTLLPETKEVWGKNGYKTKGSWEEVFGKNEWADEVFMAYYMGRYVNQVVKDGKAQLNLPMYVNAWLGPQPKADLPGQWPSGGPVARMMDIYRAAAPLIDFFAPDIYVPDFKGTCALYARSGNPLFIPEARDEVGNLFFALGRYSALGWSPFGIEDLNPDGQVAQAYKVLFPLLPQLAEWQAAGKVNGILVVDGEKSEAISLGGYKITLSPGMEFGPPAPKPDSDNKLGAGVSLESRAMPSDKRPFAIVVNTAPDEFLFIGSNGDPAFTIDSGQGKVIVAAKDEVRYENGKWMSGRRINGDELFGSSLPKLKVGMVKVKLVRLQ